jgi:hypothetical protein
MDYSGIYALCHDNLGYSSKYVVYSNSLNKDIKTLFNKPIEVLILSSASCVSF